MLKFGVIGCGGISDRFCGVLAKEENVELVAVAARNTADAEAFAKKHGARRACTYEELTRDGEVDIVFIGTVHSRHCDQIKLCLRAGKHVLCEKPMVLTGDDARECFGLAKEKGLLLMENMWTRANPCVRKAAEWVRNGQIGEVKLITLNFCFKAPFDPQSRLFNPEVAGGAVYDVGVYAIEFATGILGENPEGLVSMYKKTGTGVDGSAGLVLSFAGGALATLNCAITVNAPHDACVYGTEGSIAIKEFWRPHDAVRFDANGKQADSIHADFEDGFSYQIHHVVELLRQGATESDLIPPADTIACADMFDQIFKAE